MGKRKSWVWQYAKRDDHKAYCLICDEESNNEFACPGGTTGAISRHLQLIHNLKPANSIHPSASVSTELYSNDAQDEEPISEDCSNGENANPANCQIPRKRRRRSCKQNNISTRICNSERTEKIHVALAKLIATNQLPLSFCSSLGFQNFMSVVEPNYKPCKEEAIKRRLNFLRASVEEKIKEDLKLAINVNFTTDCWTSLSQESYITLTAHFINAEWCAKSYTLTTHEMENRHTAQNLADELWKTFLNWEIDGKLGVIVTDNAANIVKAVSLLPEEVVNVTCAAHTLQLAINVALKEESIQDIIQNCCKLVGHFKHSNVAKQALEHRQEQLSIPKVKLLQACPTRWNSTYMMLERLYNNRCAISNVLVDRSVTDATAARKFEITENQWIIIESLVENLKPLDMVTKLFCGDNHSPISIVRPSIKLLLDKHLKFKENDDEMISKFKQTLISEIKTRFKINARKNVTLEKVACFLDPRYKDLEHEPIEVREAIRNSAKRVLEKISPQKTIQDNIKKSKKTALQFLYDDEDDDLSDLTSEYQNYLAEPELKYDLNPFDWWKIRATKYPAIRELAIRYLAVPATSASSERTFSTAGNIVTSKRSSLLPENVNLLVNLYQNRMLID